MNKIINSYQEYIEELKKSKGHDLLLSTYGLTLDIELRGIFKNAKSLKILVGLYDRYCYKGCPHCERLIKINQTNIKQYQEEFPNSIKPVYFLHKKISLFNGVTIIGGFNLTGSAFIDNAIKTTDKNIFISAKEIFLEQYESTEEIILKEYSFKVVKFGKYRGREVDEMLKDKSYINYVKSVMEKEQFRRLIEGESPLPRIEKT